MSLADYVKEAEAVYHIMEKRYPEVKWEPEIFFLDLVEEIGELSNAILCVRRHKFPHRQKSELEDAFFDVLFDLFLLASKMKIDLEKEWKKGIHSFKKRLESGEFDPREI